MTPTIRSLGVVTIASGRRSHLEQQARSLVGQPVDRYVIVDLGGPDPRVSVPDELDPIVVRLSAPDGQLPLAAARNAGCAAADADVTVFLDVDCVAHPDLVRSYGDLVLADPGVHAGPVGYLPVDAPRSIDPDVIGPLGRYQPGRPQPGTALHRCPRIEMFWSLSFAVDAASWGRIGGFDERYVGYGGEDTDFARRADRSGVPIWFSGGPQAFHQFHPVSSPPVEHLLAICRNAALFHRTWGSWPMEGWLSAFADAGLIEWSPSGDGCRPVVGGPVG